MDKALDYLRTAIEERERGLPLATRCEDRANELLTPIVTQAEETLAAYWMIVGALHRLAKE